MNETGNSSALGRFLTLADVAEVLNISTGAAYSLVRSGELPAIKVGRHGHWRIERTVLESYIEAKYEEARRIKAWREAEFDRIAEPVFGAEHVGADSTSPSPASLIPGSPSPGSPGRIPTDPGAPRVLRGLPRADPTGPRPERGPGPGGRGA